MENLNFAEFYITNVCNLVCENCNRFNDFSRRGKIDFDEKKYIDFSQKFNISRISILGGEPLLHPNLFNYVKGIRKLWPDCSMVITSNGLLINKVKHLYEYCVANECELEISFHDKGNLDLKIWKEIDYFKINNGKGWGRVKTEILHHVGRDNEKFTTEAKHLQDERGFKFLFTDAHFFSSTSIKEWRESTTPIPHNSDPEKAYHECTMKFSHTFFDGELYKCGFIAAAKEFITERKAQEHWQKLWEYQPINMNQFSPGWKSRFFSPEDVCSLCPERLNYDWVKTKLKNE